jgi:hypothetical protein
MTVKPLFSSPFGNYRRGRIVKARLLYQPETSEVLRHVVICSAANDVCCCRPMTHSPACWIDPQIFGAAASMGIKALMTFKRMPFGRRRPLPKADRRSSWT